MKPHWPFQIMSPHHQKQTRSQQKPMKLNHKIMSTLQLVLCLWDGIPFCPEDIYRLGGDKFGVSYISVTMELEGLQIRTWQVLPSTFFFFYFNNNTCTLIYKNAQTTNNNDKCKQYDMFCLTHKIIMQYVMSNNVINLKQFFDLHFLWFPITHALYCQVVWIWTNDWNMLKSLYTP